MQESPFKGARGVRRLLNALRYSLQGLAAAFRHEEAFRLELSSAVVLVPAAFFVPASGTGSSRRPHIPGEPSAGEACQGSRQCRGVSEPRQCSGRMASGPVRSGMSDLLVRTALAVLGIAVPAFLAGFLFGSVWG